MGKARCSRWATALWGKKLMVWLPLVLAWPCQLSAQTTPEEMEYLKSVWYLDYGFVNYSENRIQTFNRSALAHVFEKMRRLEDEGDEKVHILQIGDSHIQADIFSGKVRENFVEDARFPMAGRGLVFPYSAARTNNPYNYSARYSGYWEGLRSVKSRHYSRWGVSGISLETTDAAATIRINPDLNGASYQTRRIKVLHPGLEGKSFVPEVVAGPGNAVTSLLQRDGVTEYVLLTPQKTVEIKLKKQQGQDRFTLQGIMLDNMQPGILYSAVGVNSADVDSYLRCTDLEQNIALVKPDLVVISLGTNDAYMYAFDARRFRQNLAKLVLKIKRAFPQTNVLLTTPADNFRRRRYPNKNNEEARQQMLALAQELDLAVWDFYSVMGGFQSITDWYSSGLAQRDRLHFTSKGYQLQGQLFYIALDRAYREHRAYMLKGQ